MELPVRHGQAVLGAGRGQPDQVLRTNIGGEDRGANRQPGRIAAGQEVVFGVFFFL